MLKVKQTKCAINMKKCLRTECSTTTPTTTRDINIKHLLRLIRSV